MTLEIHEKKPKIAYFVSMVSGLETFVKNEVEALHRKGFMISLFVTKYRKSRGFNPSVELSLFKPRFLDVLTGLITTVLLHPRLFILLLREGVKYKSIFEFLLAMSWFKHIEKESCDVLHAAFGDRKFFIFMILR